MKKVNGTLYEGLGSGFISKEQKICMIRCFDCGQENYSPVISLGYCAKCGYDPNKKPNNISIVGSKNSNKNSSD